MNFKEALIAHLQGEEVEVSRNCGENFIPFSQWHGVLCLTQIEDPDFAIACKYRIKPRTIFVNGVKVPAPEEKALKNGTVYYVSAPHSKEKYSATQWVSDDLDTYRLSEGVIYLNKEDAIARAKAMLIYKEV